jgi:hypothetical protein
VAVEAKRALDPGELYLVSSDHDPTALLALDAKVRGGYVTWFDTNRDRGHPIKDVKTEGDAIVFETERGWVYRFVPLTLEAYEEQVRAKVELSPEFKTREELKKFYLEHFLSMNE